jgi:hypothetical protein
METKKNEEIRSRKGAAVGRAGSLLLARLLARALSMPTPTPRIRDFFSSPEFRFSLYWWTLCVSVWKKENRFIQPPLLMNPIA